MSSPAESGSQLSALSSQLDRNYPEDRSRPTYGDGHTCLKCGGLYSGVRGRWVCRVCDTPVSVRAELLALRGWVEVYRNECAEILLIQYEKHPTAQTTTELAQRVHRLDAVLPPSPGLSVSLSPFSKAQPPDSAQP